MRTLTDLVKSFQFDTIIAMFTNDLPPWIVPMISEARRIGGAIPRRLNGTKRLAA